jgi:trigger factor
MDIISKPYSALDGVITIQFHEEDYLPIIAKNIQAERAKMSMKGFRTGQVPTSLVKKIYGHKLLFDVTLKLALQELSNYLENQQLLSMPIMLNSTFDTADHIDVENPGILEFSFIYALKPNIDLSTLKEIHVNRYEITEISDNYVMDYIHKMRILYGTKEEIPVATKEDMLYVSFYDADETQHEVYLPAEGMQLGDRNFSFVDLKPGDTFTVDFGLGEAYLQLPTDNHYYDKTESKFHHCSGEYNLEVKKIYQITLVGIDDVLAKHPFPRKNGSTLEAFKAYIRDHFIQEVQQCADNIVANEIEKLVIEHLTFDLPNNFIKTKLERDSMQDEDEDEGDEEDEEDKEQDTDSEIGSVEEKLIRWTLLKDEVCKIYDRVPKANNIALYIRTTRPDYEKHKSIEKLTEEIKQNLNSNTPNKLYSSVNVFFRDIEARKLLTNLVTLHTEQKTVAEFEEYLREKNKKQSSCAKAECTHSQ